MFRKYKGFKGLGKRDGTLASQLGTETNRIEVGKSQRSAANPEKTVQPGCNNLNHALYRIHLY